MSVMIAAERLILPSCQRNCDAAALSCTIGFAVKLRCAQSVQCNHSPPATVRVACVVTDCSDSSDFPEIPMSAQCDTSEQLSALSIQSVCVQCAFSVSAESRENSVAASDDC